MLDEKLRDDEGNRLCTTCKQPSPSGLCRACKRAYIERMESTPYDPDAPFRPAGAEYALNERSDRPDLVTIKRRVRFKRFHRRRKRAVRGASLINAFEVFADIRKEK